MLGVGEEDVWVHHEDQRSKEKEMSVFLLCWYELYFVYMSQNDAKDQ